MKDKPSPLAFLNNPWNVNDNGIWLASTITLYRNLEKYKFPPKAGLDKRQQIVSLVEQQIARNVAENELQTILAEEIGPYDKEFLSEHFLTQETLNQTHTGEAFLLAPSSTIFLGINLQNHLTFHILDCTGELEKSLAELIKLETTLGDSLSYAFSPCFGFLTTDPLICGTALSAATFLQVPALIHTGVLEEVLEKNSDEMLTISGLLGGNKEKIGDVLVARNNFTLGVTEEKIISALNVFTTKIQVAEASEQAKLSKKDNPEIKDKISRAYAILLHSYQLETAEAMNAISLLKLGLGLGWVENTSRAKLNSLFFACRRGHLLCHLADKVEQEQLAHRRAEFIHQNLGEVKLHL